MSQHDDFFIGWSADMPKPDRRAFLGAGLGLMAGTAGLGFAVAHHQNPVGPGSWAMGDVRTWTGIATAEPYAMLRTLDVDGTPRTALLGCLGKCGVAARIGALAGQPVTVTGSLIQRGRHAMIAVIDGMDWIATADTATTAIEALAFPPVEDLGQVSLNGEILDTKCWFGAMHPSEGKVHKACAALCIRGGLPPAFYTETPDKQSALMIMTDAGMGHGPGLLPYVADPVRITAQLQRQGDLLLLDSSPDALTRL